MNEKKVYANKGAVEYLMKKFECGRSEVSMALNFKRNSKKARGIRSYAINHLKCYFTL